MLPQKFCRKCSRNLPMGSFHSDKTKNDLKRTTCRDCDASTTRLYRKSSSYKEKKREYYKANRETILKNSKVRYDPLKQSIYYKNWYAHNKKKKRVHWITRKAIQKGSLIKEKCFNCGDEKTLAHHSDYNKPLDVVWFCVRCHLRWHAENKPIL